MNKPLVERIDELRWRITNQRELSELDSILADVRELVEALKEGRRAIGDHFAPNDCYATGPATGNYITDLIECPACSFIAKYDAIQSLTHPTETPR